MTNSEISPAAAHMTSKETDELGIARQRLASLNPDDEVYFNSFNIFINKLIAHSVQSRNPSGFEEAISRTKQILDLAPPGHHFHAPALCLIGMAFVKRFKLLGDTNDLKQGVDHLEGAVDLCAPSHPLYPPFLVNLANGLLERYRTYGDTTDLNRIIETISAALPASPQSPQRDSLLNNLGTALKERSAKLGNSTDLDDAIKHFRSCLHLRPPGHPLRYSALGNLASAMLLQYEIHGDLQDLEDAASHYDAALHLRSPGEEGYLFCLTSLGVVHCHYFHLEGKVERLERAIGFYQMAMGYSRLPDLDQSRLLDNYSAALVARYSLARNVNDLDQAIHFLTTSLGITSPGYCGRHITLFNLGITHVTRFEAAGNISDLDFALDILVLAIQSCLPASSLYPAILSARSLALSLRSIARGDMQDFSLAISMCKDCLALLSPNGQNYPWTIASLTSTLLHCFEKLGSTEECQTIIDLCDHALISIPPVASITFSLRINRAMGFLQRSQLGGEEKDLDTCIAALREVILTVPDGHKEHLRAHMELGTALETHFRLAGDSAEELDESIALYRIAHRHCHRGNSLYIQSGMRLGNALRQRFEYQYNTDALDEAIVFLAEAEETVSSTLRLAEYKDCLVNLGAALFSRFQAQRDRADLDMAIERATLALTLPPCKEEFALTIMLATLLSARHSEDRDLEDLERSIELFDVATRQTPPKHHARSILCHNYGRALVRLGKHRNQLEHLNTAIAFLTETIQLSPPSHYEQPQTCLTVVQALMDRANLLQSDDDLATAVNLIRGMIGSLPGDSPTSYQFFRCAAGLCMYMYMASQQRLPTLMEEGFRCYERAARYTSSASFWSVSVALEWVDYAKKLHHSSALSAYQTCLPLLNQHLLATGAPITNRYTALSSNNWINHPGTLATDAASCAIALDELALAVELSEEGRGLLWSQLSQSRTPLDGLRSAGETGRELASAFERVSTQLAWRAVTQDELPLTLTAPRMTAEAEARRYRQLSQEMADIIARIRQLEGFQSFLDRPSFDILQRAADGGPVILVNVSRQRCDAIIVLNEVPPRLVPLPGTSLAEITMLEERLRQVLQTTTHVGQEKVREQGIALVLRTLWDTIVRPIVDELTPLVPRGSRIWWCPTSKLTTLPLHAAGPYRRGALNLPSIYVSSYTPTLAALVRARQPPPASSPRPPPAFIAIGQANPAFAGATGPVLASVAAELALVASLLPTPGTYTLATLSGDAGTADAALAALATHGWAHIACHGYPNPRRPFDACFALRDRAVTVLDIIRARGVSSSSSDDAHASARYGGLAFLSACHTAANVDRGAPDEMVHLAAAMQFGGFRSVVGTMWAVDDGMVQYMVKAFYEAMFRPAGTDEVWDCTRAARALHKAARVVDKDVVSLDQRIVFIHIGA